MILTKSKPVSVGTILTEEFLVPLGMSRESLAGLAGLTLPQVTAICEDVEPLTEETSNLLAKVFSNSPDFWLNLQRRIDRWQQERGSVPAKPHGIC
ncbi:HigA family addiction module antidote protein [Pseudomonas aeruginosa]|nr:HigA family addiction module antidote protein [Pseudomonas aeruginosa]